MTDKNTNNNNGVHKPLNEGSGIERRGGIGENPKPTSTKPGFNRPGK